VAFGLPTWIEGRSAPSRRAMSWAAGASVMLCCVAAVIGQASASRATTPLHDPDTGATLELGEAFTFERRHHGGPLLATLGELLDALGTGPGSGLLVNDALEIERRPVVPMNRYVERAREASPRALNVIVVIVESLRQDQLTLLGSPRVVMPNVEGLAAAGRVYSNAYTQASHSDFADPCVLSGQYPIRGPFGAPAYVKDPDYPRVLIYDVLHALGYRTALISSQNESWGGMIDFLDTGNLDLVLHSETFDGPTYVPHGDPVFAGWVKGERRAGKIDDRITVGEAIRWIAVDDPRPFFIYMNLQNSHVPYELPTDFPRRFSSDTYRPKFTLAQIATEDVPLVKDLYADSLAYVDLQLGRLFDHLRAQGLWEETVVVVTGDTGQAFMEHGFFTHARDLYNEVMQVPIVVSAPGLDPIIDDRLAQHVDIAPTILEILGLPEHPAFQGSSLLRTSPNPDRSAYLAVRTPMAHQYAVIRGGLKLISDRRKKQVLLYDLRTDPGERKDLSRHRPAVARALRARVETWLHHQIEHFRDPERRRNEYPPVLRD
jgi:arylsulfatase A-like enzyme